MPPTTTTTINDKIDVIIDATVAETTFNVEVAGTETTAAFGTEPTAQSNVVPCAEDDLFAKECQRQSSILLPADPNIDKSVDDSDSFIMECERQASILMETNHVSINLVEVVDDSNKSECQHQGNMFLFETEANYTLETSTVDNNDNSFIVEFQSDNSVDPVDINIIDAEPKAMPAPLSQSTSHVHFDEVVELGE